MLHRLPKAKETREEKVRKIEFVSMKKKTPKLNPNDLPVLYKTPVYVGSKTLIDDKGIAIPCHKTQQPVIIQAKNFSVLQESGLHLFYLDKQLMREGHLERNALLHVPYNFFEVKGWTSDFHSEG